MSHARSSPTRQLPPLTAWGRRVGATLIDWLAYLVALVPYWIGYGRTVAQALDSKNTSGKATAAPDVSPDALSWSLMGIGVALALAIFIVNQCLRQGRTGYTWGKGLMGVRLVSETTGEPIGGWQSFVRQLVHILDSLPCYLGFLAPLWDPKRRTWADRMLGTVVVDQPKD